MCCKQLFKKLKLPLSLSLTCLFFKFTREMTKSKYCGQWKPDEQVDQASSSTKRKKSGKKANSKSADDKKEAKTRKEAKTNGGTGKTKGGKTKGDTGKTKGDTGKTKEVLIAS